MFCPKCGTQVRDQDNFCVSCGIELKIKGTVDTGRQGDDVKNEDKALHLIKPSASFVSSKTFGHIMVLVINVFSLCLLALIVAIIKDIHNYYFGYRSLGFIGGAIVYGGAFYLLFTIYQWTKKRFLRKGKKVGKNKKVRNILYILAFVFLGCLLVMVINGIIDSVAVSHERFGKLCEDTSKANDDTITHKQTNIILVKSENRRLSGQPYIDPNYNFSIHSPQGWKVKNALLSKRIIIKAITQTDDYKTASVSIRVYGLDESLGQPPIRLKKVSELILKLPTENVRLEELRRLFASLYHTKLKVIEVGIEKLNGKNSIWCKLRGEDIYTIAYYILHQDMLFLITGTTSFGDYAWYKENEEALISSIKTFKFF